MIGIEHLFLNRSRKVRRRLAWVLGALFLFFPIVLTPVAWDAGRVWTWIATPCTIVSSDVHVKNDERATEPYEFRVTYEYIFAGMKRRASQYTLYWGGDNRFTNAADAYRLAREFKPGMHTSCFVNPKRPDEAVLVRSNPALVIAIAVAVLVVGAGWVRMYVNANGGRSAEARKREERMAAALLVLIGVTIYIWLAGWPLLATLRTLSWSEVPCTVVRSGIEVAEHDSRHGTFWSFRNDILYRYQISGEELHSNRVSFLEGHSVWQPRRHRLLREIPAGTHTTCYYNPHDANESVLRRDLGNAIMEATWPLICVVIAFAGRIPFLRRALNVRRPAAWANVGVAIALTLVAIDPTRELARAGRSDYGLQDILMLLALWLSVLGCLIAGAVISARPAKANHPRTTIRVMFPA